jgi:hypothetical protein
VGVDWRWTMTAALPLELDGLTKFYGRHRGI